MKKIILIFIFVNIALTNYAQTFQISGKVADEKDNTVEFADVLLLQNNSTVQYQLTDETGEFAFNAARGKYILLIRQMGDTLYNKIIDITQNANLGIIQVQHKPNVLQAAVVTAEKKIFERKFDRMVFNVVDLPEVEGGDVMDVLKITPGLIVNNSSIEIIGKSGVDIMINDRPVMLSGEALLNFLRGLRSSDIQSIEVITTPPAKYEAEGNSGLVNIILKKIENNTWSASVFSNYYQYLAKYAENQTGGSFNYRKKNLSFYLNASYYFGKNYNDDETIIYYPELRWESRGNFTHSPNSINAQTGFDVEITDKWTVGAQYMGNMSRPKPTIDNNRTDLFDIANNNAGQITTQSNSKSKSDIHSGNFHSIIKLDTLGRKINFDFDILSYKANNNETYAANTSGSTYTEIPNGLQSKNNILDRKITNYATQIDVEHPFKKFSLNYGMKLSFSHTDNDIHVFDLASGIPVNDPGQTNQFIYKENIQALYISGKATLGKWEMQLGLRGENTRFTGNSVTKDTVFKKSYFELFPTAYIAYNHNDKNIFYAEYGRRINRPGFSHLNPFRSYSSPYYSFEGNPELKPTIITNVELSYVYNNMFQTALFYSGYKDNSGGGVVLLDDDGYTQRALRLNYFDGYETGIRIVYIFRKLNWWTSGISVSGYYQHSDSKIFPLTPKTMSGYGAYIQTSNTFYLNNDKTISCGFTLGYVSPGTSLALNHNYSRINLDPFARILFFDRTLSVSLQGNNLLNEYSFNWRSERSGILLYSRAHYDPRYVRLSVSYSFGSKKVKVEQREVSNSEEKGRVN
ncbi:MAG: TonB-dependent receptor [Prevotellaceae bacterium]|jgi:outer membrane receptor protein involved in Fe transport|nr:TonB-dependent receptor [Prevotellaceae bacterium]